MSSKDDLLRELAARYGEEAERNYVLAYTPYTSIEPPIAGRLTLKGKMEWLFRKCFISIYYGIIEMFC